MESDAQGLGYRVGRGLAHRLHEREITMSVTVAYASKLTVTEVLETNVPAGSDVTVKHTLYDSSATVTAATVTKVAIFEQALTGGAATINLAALTGTNGATVVGTGLRVQFLKFRNKSTNANVMTLSQGASNGYDGFGTSFSITLDPGAEVLVRTLDGGEDIGAANRTLDLAGTGTQTAEVEIVLG